MGKLALIFTLTLAAAVLSLGVVEVQAQDDESVLRELRPLAEEGDAEAQYELGRMYQLGWGVEQDGSVAEKWYLRAAEQGHDEAQFELGALYESGWLWGIPDDHEAAVEWYRRAAEGGNSGAQASLGAMYNLGRGVPKNKVYAYMWLSVAVENGNDFASEVREIVAEGIVKGIGGMSVGQIARGHRLALKCIEQNYKEC